MIHCLHWLMLLWRSCVFAVRSDKGFHAWERSSNNLRWDKEWSLGEKNSIENVTLLLELINMFSKWCYFVKQNQLLSAVKLELFCIILVIWKSVCTEWVIVNPCGDWMLWSYYDFLSSFVWKSVCTEWVIVNSCGDWILWSYYDFLSSFLWKSVCTEWVIVNPCGDWMLWSYYDFLSSLSTSVPLFIRKGSHFFFFF